LQKRILKQILKPEMSDFVLQRLPRSALGTQCSSDKVELNLREWRITKSDNHVQQVEDGAQEVEERAEEAEGLAQEAKERAKRAKSLHSG